MAIIKCPECGHAISDKAPMCPSCGVEIAGHTVRCPQCGATYFKNQPECPSCHHLTTMLRADDETAKNSVLPPVPPTPSYPDDRTQPTIVTPSDVEPQQSTPAKTATKSKRSVRIAIVLLVVVIVAAVAGFAFFTNAENSKETAAYEYALGSNDPMVLQSYLETYADAPEDHIATIQSHLEQLQQLSQEWNDAVISGTKSAIEQFLANHPDSPYKALAQSKIDSLDWETAQSANTVEAYENYIESHQSGKYVDEANESIKELNSKTVQPEEKQVVAAVFRNFFSGINSKDEDLLTGTVSQLMTSFLGKPDATRSDVITFLRKIYKDNVASMSWTSNGDYNISKKEIGNDQYEYGVEFSAEQSVLYSDATEKINKYRIKAIINPDGLITELGMTKLLE